MKFDKFKKLASGVGLAVSLAFAAGSAQSSQLHVFEDDDLDFIVRGGAVLVPGPITTPNPILLGDIFVSAIEIPTATLDTVSVIPPGQQMTGVAAIQLVACFTGNPAFGGAPTLCGLPGANFFAFAPVATGLDSILLLAGATPLLRPETAAGGGAMVALYLNGTSGAGGDRNLDLGTLATNCTSFNDCIQQSSLGNPYQIDGFTGDPDNFWGATVLGPGGDINDGAAAGATTPIADVFAALGTFFHAGGTAEYIDIITGNPCGTPGNIPDGCAQITIHATVTGGNGLSNEAFAHSDFDAQKWIAEVPEPGTLALLGLGLAGLGFGARRKTAAA